MNFCSHCGAGVSLRIPEGDSLPRFVCDRCQTIHYVNPKVVTGCIPVWQEKILLCRRAIEPRYGLWTLPAGFLENGETSMAGAAREALEEANAVVEDLRLYGLFNLPHIDQIYMMFRGNLRHGQAAAGAESLEVQLFAENDIPWQELAFPVVAESLRLFFADRRSGRYGIHYADVVRDAQQRVTITRYP